MIYIPMTHINLKRNTGLLRKILAVFVKATHKTGIVKFQYYVRIDSR